MWTGGSPVEAEGLEVETTAPYHAADDDLGDGPVVTEPDPGEATDGFSDSSGTVRVWLDAGRRLVQVRISNRWRERARGTSLTRMFDEAFLVANALGAGLALPASDAPATALGSALGWDTLQEIHDRTTNVLEKAARLDHGPEAPEPARWEGRGADGTSRNHMVQVYLSVHGSTESVWLDDGWLADAKVAEICDAVQEAHQDAYASFVPPTYVPGDHERLAVELEALQQETLALLHQGSGRQEGLR